MIAVTLEGRLGNQLFQYAFIYAASRRLNTSFYLDKSIENFVLPKYFEVKNDFLIPLDKSIFSIKGFKNTFRGHLKKRFYRVISSKIFKGNKITFDNRTPVKDILNQLKNDYLYKGYFHSVAYFEDFSNEIRALYKIKKRHIKKFELVKKKAGISKKTAVVHVRRSDYIDLEWTLPVSYYKEAIEKIGQADVEYIFVSDDAGFIEKEFNYIPNKYISTNKEIVDLQFLINADICILSNSSFSWWGAWLNNNPGKQVYAPKHWLGYKEGKEYPEGISENVNIKWIPV